ncbi:hypothetical protein AB6A40_008792 [Gnathostoma spinigerum]|uniref:Uncharacterized protein n=1 Tax=Gnathostoma spinigerum TaxID=75299 RepID=A0ABD6EQF2_9BILA
MSVDQSIRMPIALPIGSAASHHFTGSIGGKQIIRSIMASDSHGHDFQRNNQMSVPNLPANDVIVENKRRSSAARQVILRLQSAGLHPCRHNKQTVAFLLPRPFGCLPNTKLGERHSPIMM